MIVVAHCADFVRCTLSAARCDALVRDWQWMRMESRIFDRFSIITFAKHLGT